MAETERTEDRPGVFGNLPRVRPAHRSPRRGEGAAASTAARPTGERPRVHPRPSPRPSTTSEAGPDPLEAKPEGSRTEQEQIGGLEDVAWAGIAVAAEAATLGVRLAGRAFEAARDAVERR
jgi:hypothetical protein